MKPEAIIGDKVRVKAGPHAGERGGLDRRGKGKEGPYRPDDQQHPVDGPDPPGGPGAAAGPDLARGPGRTRGLDRAGWRNPAT